MKVYVYTREVDKDSYPDGLARSVHMACGTKSSTDSGEERQALNRNYGILMHENIYFENQSINSKLIYQTAFIWSRINQKIDKVLLPYNLNTAKFNILMVIKHSNNGDGLKQNEISEQLLTTKSNIAKMLDKLEAEGLITRNSVENDKRVKIIKVTKTCSEILDKIWKEYSICIDEISPQISEKAKKDLLNTLSEWLFILNKS